MKKSPMAILTASVCVALSLSAFALPCFANASLNKEQGSVLEKETPQEYMEDFYAQDQSADNGMIFLTESQVHQLVTAAELAYKEKFGIEIPDGLEFECTANIYDPESKNVDIQLTWSGSTAEQQTIFYYASFESTDFLNEPAKLRSISALNGFDTVRFEVYEEEGLAALKQELELTVPDDYIASIYLDASFTEARTGTRLTFYWKNPAQDAKRSKGEDTSSLTYYIAGFDKVDLSQNTGRLTGIEKTYEYTQQTIMDEREAPGYIEFTNAQQNDMLEAAKQFLVEKGIETGNLRRSLQITIEEEPVMWFTFEAPEMNDSAQGSVYITIAPDFTILGYSY